MTTITEIRREAKQAGVRWADVIDVYRAMRADEDLRRERDREIREFVWMNYAYTRDCLEFWRHGMQRRFPAAFDGGDRDMIPGFDEVAQEAAGMFGEFNRDDDPAERLWDYLITDYIRQTAAADLYRQALLAIIASGDSDPAFNTDVSFEFGHNLTF